MVKFNEEQLTAYALGEVSDEQAKQIEALLDFDAQREIKELQDMASLLESEFKAEPQQKLTNSRRNKLFKKNEPLKISARPRRIRYLTAAAGLVISVSALGWLFSPSYSRHKIALMTADSSDKDLEHAEKLRDHLAMTKREGQPKGRLGIVIKADAIPIISKSPIQYEVKVKPSKIGMTSLNPTPLTADQLKTGFYSHPVDPGDSVQPRPSDYQQVAENQFKAVSADPLSTFSIDVDTASYANVRRFLKRNTQVPASAVRIEEMINYFHYDYTPPTGDTPFAAHVEVSQCPWNLKNRLVRVGIKGKVIEKEKRPASNLVFLIDVSGSMGYGNKLPLLIRGMKMMVNQLGENDRVAIVVYASATGLVLPSTSCTDKTKIIDALSRLRSGGSTNGGAGIQLAYQTAVANFIEGGTNRVILATDGDFNVGLTNQSSMVSFAKDKAKSGVFLTVLGFGMNHRDSMLEQIANKGNGHYAVIDSFAEAKKVLVDELSGTLVTIAKDVKLQLEFNPNQVKSYRLIGYENRVLAHKDFNDDKKDAGEIGAGHTVTALYEIVPGKSAQRKTPGVDPLKYQEKNKLSKAAENNELLTLKIRYKKPEESVSKLLSFPVTDSNKKYSAASNEFKFAASVASFGMILRKSKHKGLSSFALVKELAAEGKGPDKNGYRAGFLSMVGQAQEIYK
ncbi:MAG: VWA domain-containing protein [Planctomycetota bacterium]|nr:VWA domain-containing protein [Planctomycetota bacterium]